MADIIRQAGAVWKGDLLRGEGTIGTGSGALTEQPYSFGTRFEEKPGTNPEELIAAAHAACYSMAFANTLGNKGYRPEKIDTRATITFSRQEGGGYRITKMRLTVRGQVPGMDEESFREMAIEGEKECPVSNLLRCGLEIELEAELI